MIMQDRAKRTMFYHDLGKGSMAPLAKLSNNSEFNIKKSSFKNQTNQKNTQSNQNNRHVYDWIEDEQTLIKTIVNYF